MGIQFDVGPSAADYKWASEGELRRRGLEEEGASHGLHILDLCPHPNPPSSLKAFDSVF